MARPDCPQCGGTGWKTVQARAAAVNEATARAVQQIAVRCECVEADREARLLARARIPRRYEHCDFDNFDTDIYEGDPIAGAWNRSLEQAKLIVESFARDYPVGTDAGLLLMGPCGVGKTHLGVAALKQLVLRGHDGLFYDYRELLKEIQDSYNAVSQTTELGVLEPVLSAELLLLDDLGASKPSLWALETLGHILNTRYNEKRTTLLATNYLDPLDVAPGAEPAARKKSRAPLFGPLANLATPDVARTYADDTLGERIGQRIRSRLYEMCRTVEILAPDYRKEVRQVGRVRP